MNPADLTLNTSPSVTSQALRLDLAAANRNNGKPTIPRVDLESIYTQLKAALGDQWAEYKAAVNAFVLGSLNQAELSWVLQPLLSPLPTVTNTPSSALPSSNSTLHLHNSLLVAVYANTLRDPPPSDVAPWVVATDKPTSASKNAGAIGANDKAEERLKKEVMAIHARDRRRIKMLKETGTAVNDGFAEMQDYKNALAVQPPDVGLPSAGGITRTNWDVEIRRRYAQPLAEETLEFPTQSEIHNRIEPICYEEGLTGGTAQGALQSCAELVEQATEVFLKELLGELYAHARSNGSHGIQTARFKRQLRHEEDEAERGNLARNPVGLLPIEMEVHAKRSPLDMQDLQLSLSLSDSYLKQDRFLAETMALARYPDLQGGFAGATTLRDPSAPRAALVNGVSKKDVRPAATVVGGFEDAMSVDDADWSWKGGSRADMEDLFGVLDDCLAAG